MGRSEVEGSGGLIRLIELIGYAVVGVFTNNFNCLRCLIFSNTKLRLLVKTPTTAIPDNLRKLKAATSCKH